MAKKSNYKFQPHGPWVHLPRVGKYYCRGCGLVALNNKPSQWALDKGCNYQDHPSYQGKSYKEMFKKHAWLFEDN